MYIYVRRTQLSMQCAAYAIQVTNKTDKKVVPHKENLTPYKERVSLGYTQSIFRRYYIILYTYESAQRSFSCQPIFQNAMLQKQHSNVKRFNVQDQISRILELYSVVITIEEYKIIDLNFFKHCDALNKSIKSNCSTKKVISFSRSLFHIYAILIRAA